MEQRIALAREQAARAAAEETIRRSTFLADASDILSSTLDADATIKTLAQFLVPFLGDMCALALVDEQRQLKRMEIAWLAATDVSHRHGRSIGGLQNAALNAAMHEALESGNVAVVTELSSLAKPHSPQLRKMVQKLKSSSCDSGYGHLQYCRWLHATASSVCSCSASGLPTANLTPEH